MGLAMLAVKVAVFVTLVAIYWHPLRVARLVVDETVVPFEAAQEHVARFALTMISYSWALAGAASWYYVIMGIIVLQTLCWASFISEEPVLRPLVPTLDLATEKELFQAGAIGLFALMLLILLFAPAGTDDKELHRKRLVAFYKKHNPDKLPEVGKILHKYAGNEELLFTRLQRKYSVLSHTPVEDAVDELDADADRLSTAQEAVEEVELLRRGGAVESEEDEGFHLVKKSSRPQSPIRSPSVKASAQAAAASPQPSRTPSPLPSPRGGSGSSGAPTSNAVRAAIEEARRAQAERVQQRVAQLAARASTKELH